VLRRFFIPERALNQPSGLVEASSLLCLRSAAGNDNRHQVPRCPPANIGMRHLRRFSSSFCDDYVIERLSGIGFGRTYNDRGAGKVDS
jgi:hypothetical protein